MNICNYNRYIYNNRYIDIDMHICNYNRYI